MSDAINLKLIKTNDCLGIPFFTGSIKFKDLVNNFRVPIYRPGTSVSDESSGYQREPSEVRINAIASRIAEKDLMTQPFVDNVNLNIRSKEVLEYVLPADPKATSHGDFFNLNYISQLGHFYVVDGQTRLKGASRAYDRAKENNDTGLLHDIGNINIQFTLSFTEDVYKEAYIFYLINQHSKRIPPEGALTLIKQGYENKSVAFENEITTQGKQTDVYTYQIAEDLNERSVVWAGQMRDFNDTSSGITILAVSKMLAPLYNIQADGVPEEEHGRSMKSTYMIVEAFWSGFKDVFPKMFSPLSRDSINVLKAGPAEIMTKVLIMLVKQAKNSTKPAELTNPEYFKNILYKLRELKDKNGLDDNVWGEGIFRVGKEGSIGRYSNNAAKSEMATKIFDHFYPRPKA